MALNKIGDSIKSHLTNVFSTDSSSPASKQGRAQSAVAAASSADGGKRSLSPGSIPFKPAEASWLRNALVDTFTVFGEHVEQKISDVEAKITTLDTRCSNELKSHAEDIHILQTNLDNLSEQFASPS